MSILVESMSRIVLPKYLIRVWRQENEGYEHTPGLYTDLESVARANETDKPVELARKIIALPRVNAVEVLDWDLGGCVLYSEWP